MLLLSLMVMIINILSSIERVGLRGLSHHVSATVVNLASVELTRVERLALDHKVNAHAILVIPYVSTTTDIIVLCFAYLVELLVLIWVLHVDHLLLFLDRWHLHHWMMEMLILGLVYGI